MGKQWLVGTAGFMVSQPLWTSLPGLNCIEVNSTFYRLPLASTIKKWKELSPSLCFSLKVSRYITHMKRLKNCKGAWGKFWGKAKLLGNKLKAVLFQLPPSFKFNDVNMERLGKMGSYLPKGGPAIVFEFRDKSWFVKPVYDLMKKLGWCLGGTAIRRPTKRYWLGNMPSGLHLPPRTSDTTYLRVHGQKGYRGYYGPKELRNIYSQIRSKGTGKNFVIFNNTFFEKRGRTCTELGKRIRFAAVCDAVAFGKMAGTRTRRRTPRGKKGGRTRRRYKN